MDSFKLKVFAIVAMTMDHVSKIFWVSLLFLVAPMTSDATIAGTSGVLNWAGRMAFPLFAFMIAEGCKHTSDMKKYLFRLGLLAVISQPFFYLAFLDFEGWRGMESVKDALLSFQTPNNVFVTLFFGALVIFIFQKLKELGKLFPLLAIPVLAAICWLAGSVLHSDYEYYGVILIVLVYFMPNKYLQAIALVLFSLAIYYIFDPYATDMFQVFASSSSALLVLAYNGQRGYPLKWLFYWYYPAHLLVCTILRVLIVGM